MKRIDAKIMSTTSGCASAWSAIGHKVCGIVVVIVAVIATGCVNSVWDEVPTSIQQFVSRYYPGSTVTSCEEIGDVYNVKIYNGAALTFNADYQWLSVNGGGVVLPEMFLFDELPPELYEYLQGLDAVDDVYAVSRNISTYSVTLLDQTVTYTISTGRITQLRDKA